MFNLNAVFDFAIGMIALFLVASLLTMALQESIAQFLDKRAKLLRETLERVLHDENSDKEALSKFFQQPLISSLITRPGSPGPSYIPREVFVQAIKTFYSTSGKAGEAAGAFLEAAKGLEENGSTARALIRQAAQQADATVQSVEKVIGDWFDAMMARVSGAYKRWTQIIVFVLGFFVAVSSNLDALAVANYLANSPAARAQFAQIVTDAVSKSGKPDAELLSKVNLGACEVRLPIGWGEPSPSCKAVVNAPEPSKAADDFAGRAENIVLKLLGFLMTALATTVGAVFWFDLLKRFVNIRAAGPVDLPKEQKRSL